MKCRDCGQEGFANVGEVTRHKASECPAKAQASKGAVIPYDMLAPEFSVLSKGTLITLIVIAAVTEDGLRIEEAKPHR